MATKEELYRIGQAGFEAIDRFFGFRRAVVPASEEKRSLYHRNEVPLETIASPYLVTKELKFPMAQSGSLLLLHLLDSHITSSSAASSQ
ncbi:hypothetical protein CDL15_Pgr016715 [Punica granatum]|uniref:Uncharacterized protein n=1 Tax=Punica granatum TaxID=22663 RepID=A0A218XV43_PUNGR|nr:hypothetical protein CDL15_Pgr016715 [Punica granatum]